VGLLLYARDQEVKCLEEQELVDAAHTDRLTEVGQKRTGWRAFDWLQQVLGPDGSCIDIKVLALHHQRDAVSFLDFLSSVGTEGTVPRGIQPNGRIATRRSVVGGGWLPGFLDVFDERLSVEKLFLFNPRLIFFY
jgi:hypothetical protein